MWTDCPRNSRRAHEAQARAQSTTQTGLAGEYLVLAELARRDAIASMTLANSKGVDILVAPAGKHVAYKVEVKTARNQRTHARIWLGDEYCLSWRLAKKHETMQDPRLFFVFVHLPDPPARPRFFLARSRDVAKYVRWEHAHWLKKNRGKDITDGDMRVFRIAESQMPRYEDNWRLLGLP